MCPTGISNSGRELVYFLDNFAMLLDGRLRLNVQGHKQNSWDWGYFIDWEWESESVHDVVFHQLLKEFILLDCTFVVAKFDCFFWHPLLIPILQKVQEATLIQRFFWALQLARIPNRKPKASLVG
jgi:hypothetical protein